MILCLVFVTTFLLEKGLTQQDSELKNVQPELSIRPELMLRPELSVPAFVFDPRLGGSSGNPGLKLRISPKGIDYANSVAGNLLNTEIRKVKIPDFEKSIKKGYVRAKNIRITGFTPPRYIPKLNSPNRVGWGTDGGKISIAGNWQGKKKALFTFRGSGTFTASASDIEISISAGFVKNSQGQPVITSVSCSSKIRSLSVKIRGGLIGWILNLFRGKIASKLKPYVEKAVCDEGKKFIQNDVNAKLRTFPTRVSLGPHFKLDYKLTSNPVVSGGSITSSHNGEISYRGLGGATFHPHSLVTSSSNSKMFYVYGSDYTLNTLLQSAHKNNRMKYTINEGNMPSVAQYLRTSCSGGRICLGSLFPELEDQYPNSKGSIVFQTMYEPTVVFSNGKASINVRGKIELLVTPQRASRPVKIVSINATLSANLTPRLTTDFEKIYGTIKITKLQVTGVESIILDLPQGQYQALSDLAIPVLEDLANKYLQRGITIPVTRGIKLRNGRLRVLQRTLEISADVTYTG